MAARFFPSVVHLTKRVRACTARIQRLHAQKAKFTKDQYSTQRAVLRRLRERLRTKKETAIEDGLNEISRSVVNGKHKISLQLSGAPGGKPVYKIDESAASFFAVKQVQRNISRLYKVKQGNRNDIVCQVRDGLRDKFPKKVVTTDFKDFYESIPRDRLLKKIDRDQLLAPTSRKIIKQIFQEYKMLTGSVLGIPRGVGVSAYLAELFAREFDRRIKMNEDIVYYARYVDDTFIIFAPDPDRAQSTNYLKWIEEIAKEMNVSLNPKKTAETNMLAPASKVFEYLGYKFTAAGGGVSIRMSQKKKLRYKKRLLDSFKDYEKKSHYNEKKARKLLVKRLRFLAGNTRLLNSKRNALVGVYYSNRHLSVLSDLKGLDAQLKYLSARITKLSLKNKLSKISFESGFKDITFSRFSIGDLSEIVQVWKNAP